MGIVRGKRIDDKDQSDASTAAKMYLATSRMVSAPSLALSVTSDRLLIFRPLCASATCAVPNSVKNMRKVKITFP